MTTEYKYALGVLQIADSHSNGLATLRRCKVDIPKYVKITAAENAPSQTRPGEPMWHQIIRNIKSHSADEGNFIAEGLLVHVVRVGYRITAAGKAYLRSKGL
jgi:hypothetical protein